MLSPTEPFKSGGSCIPIVDLEVSSCLQIPIGNPLQEPTRGPQFEQQDWEAMESGTIAPDGVSENGDFRYDEEPDGELPEEDDDNPYQESDEALPEDKEERVISRAPSKEGSLFDEV